MATNTFTYISVKEDGTKETTERLKTPYKIERPDSSKFCAIIRPLYGKTISDVGKAYCVKNNKTRVLVIQSHPETNFNKETLFVYNRSIASLNDEDYYV